MKTIGAGVFRSYTNERMIIDVVTPGVNPSTIEVSKVDFESKTGEFTDYSLKVTAQAAPRATKHLGADQVLGNVKEVIQIREDYDISKTICTYRDGVIRLDVPKFTEGLATPVDVAAAEILETESTEG